MTPLLDYFRLWGYASLIVCACMGLGETLMWWRAKRRKKLYRKSFR